ncbi:DUF4166 domain-containing protein [Roseibium sp. MMSF_3412]|uniref:DUF4166 domain-containing protein n=1 Tax=Roseibium sp. MMSF_3412 TaxID=3046712 RepID=UPI00273DAF63|nr:DUF4166 domain-containing protein [Roseibium sp. MMSF_3412]
MTDRTAAALTFASGTDADDTPCLFHRALGARFDDLPQAVRDLHTITDEKRWQGRASVTRGKSGIGSLICRIVGFPPEAVDIPVSVTIERRGHTEVWCRDFGGNAFKSVLCLRDTEQRGHITERFGVMAFDIDLQLEDGRLHFPVSRGRILGLPMPRAVLPVSQASEFETDGHFHFDVQVSLPGVGVLVRYQGHLSPVQSDV